MIRPALMLLIAILSLLSGPTLASDFEGYWRLAETEDSDYDKYLKVTGDSGYYCVRDGKSSFRFKIIGDSITTPMNGKNAIVSTSPTTLRITGEEKGETYATDFRAMPASGYPQACEDEEREWFATVVIGKAVPGPGRPGIRLASSQVDALGRSGSGVRQPRRIFPSR